MSGYRTSVLTLDGNCSIETLEHPDDPAAVAFTGTVTRPVAWFEEGQFLRLNVISTENDDTAQPVNDDGVVTQKTTLACLVNGDASEDEYQFVVAITPPANYSVKQLCQELMARASSGLQREGIIGPTALVAFEHDGQLILIEAWVDDLTHRTFLEYVLYRAAADMGFRIEDVTLVMLKNGSARTRGLHEFLAA